MNGITYYRLESQYEGDITKNCALTGAEVDNNFNTLEGRDVKSIVFEEGKITLNLMNGEVLSTDDITEGTVKDLSFDFNPQEGVLTITQNDTTQTITGFITEDNIEDYINEHHILPENNAIRVDSTIVGDGTNSQPIKVSPTMRTGQFASVKNLIKIDEDNNLPKPTEVIVGDRFLTEEIVNEFGYLYNYIGLQKIASQLTDTNSQWRIPTKEDWDDMLNAIEVNEEYKNHDDTRSNTYLGQLAGKFLKSEQHWTLDNSTIQQNATNTDTQSDINNDNCTDPYCGEFGHSHYLDQTTNQGINLYGFNALPSGYANEEKDLMYLNKRAYFWTDTHYESRDAYIKALLYNKSNVFQDIVASDNFMSIRLVKDYHENNHNEYEEILGGMYPTVLMPSQTKNHRIWMAMNLSDSIACTYDVDYIKPTDSGEISSSKRFFINEWDGKKWLKKQLKEGDSVVILEDNHNEYRVVNGELKNVLEDTQTQITTLLNTKGDNIVITQHENDVELELSSGERGLDSAHISKATTTKAGVMSAADKAKLDGIEEEANKTIVDSALSSTSENPVQNKVLKPILDRTIYDTFLFEASSEDGGGVEFIFRDRQGNRIGGGGDRDNIPLANTNLDPHTSWTCGLMSNEDKIALDEIKDVIDYYKRINTIETPKFINLIDCDENGNPVGEYFDVGINSATTTKAGVMSADDKNKLDGIEADANKTIVDDALSTTSENPVQNKVVTAALNTKVDNIQIEHPNNEVVIKLLNGNTIIAQDSISPATNANAGVLTWLDKQKLDGIEEHANRVIVDSALNHTSPNAIQNQVVTTSLNTKYDDIISMLGSSGWDITFKANGAIVYELYIGGATSTEAGLFLPSEKTKLDALPTADTLNTTLAGKADGISTQPNADSVSIELTSGNTTLATASILDASAYNNGLMSASDKTKLDGIEAQANKTIVDNELNTNSENPVQNKVVKAELDNKMPRFGDGEYNSTQQGATIKYYTQDGYVITLTTIPNANMDTNGLMSVEDKQKLAEVDDKTITQEGTSFNRNTGVLTLANKGGIDNIEVQMGFNFGTF